jgi:hypothetical protein
LKDLRGIAGLFSATSAAERKTRTLTYVSGPGAATFTFKCDVDYYFIGVGANSGAQVQLSTSGKALIALGTKADFPAGDLLFLSTTTTLAPCPIHHDFLAKDTTLTLQISAASWPVSIVLEYA